MIDTRTLTNLTVDATPDSDVERRLETALGFAAQFGSSLTAVCSAWPDGVSFADAIAHSPFSSLAQERELRSGIARVSSAFDRLARGKTVDTQWCDSIAHPSAAILDHALLADLVVMSTAPTSDFAHADALEVAARSGSPVLRLGPEAPTTSFKNILICWRDSRESRCALRAAVPMLQHATRIVLAGVGEDVSSDRLAEVGDYLSLYGVEAQTLHLSGNKATPGTLLADLSRREDFHLVVAGARAHGLWKERIFGGVTRDFLAATDINWLLAN
ncbi:universal stress protein [Sphingomonas sp. KC8]|jgi:nucleotide-binding universal stress UspA family protein|uniref:universal stress protein n=1 Tax=Sphingomonas sp. KC8 TaxID=1030157 RepID=UPI000248941C|nr:universal stress protein [Sphingomonas sp. KC8]ARS26446.1 universal stress protein UspA [Sphingomonas sp. KC8]